MTNFLSALLSIKTGWATKRRLSFALQSCGSRSEGRSTSLRSSNGSFLHGQSPHRGHRIHQTAWWMQQTVDSQEALVKLQPSLTGVGYLVDCLRVHSFRILFMQFIKWSIIVLKSCILLSSWYLFSSDFCLICLWILHLAVFSNMMMFIRRQQPPWPCAGGALLSLHICGPVHFYVPCIKQSGAQMTLHCWTPMDNFSQFSETLKEEQIARTWCADWLRGVILLVFLLWRADWLRSVILLVFLPWSARRLVFVIGESGKPIWLVFLPWSAHRLVTKLRRSCWDPTRGDVDIPRENCDKQLRGTPECVKALTDTSSSIREIVDLIRVVKTKSLSRLHANVLVGNRISLEITPSMDQNGNNSNNSDGNFS